MAFLPKGENTNVAVSSGSGIDFSLPARATKEAICPAKAETRETGQWQG